MVHAYQLGGAREDLINVLAVAVGRTQAIAFVDGLEARIQSEAQAGAEKAIPQIKAEVKATAASAIKPWLIGLAVGVAAAIGLGGYAVWRSRR